MKHAPRRLAGLFLCLASSLSLAAAPGELTSIGPFGQLDHGVDDLVFAGADPKHLLALAGGDVFETRDGGANWRSLLGNHPEVRATSLRVDPADAEHFFLTTADDRVLRTTDGGRSFAALTLPDVFYANDPRVFIDAATPRLMLLALRDNRSDDYFFTSRDWGASWVQAYHYSYRSALLGFHRGVIWLREERYDLATGQWTDHPPLNPDIGGFFPLLVYAKQIYFDRVRPGTLFAINHEDKLFRSADDGQTFLELPAAPPVAGLAQSPVNGSHLAIWSDGLRLSLDRGATWADQGTAFDGVRQADFDPASGELLLVRDGEIQRRRLDGTLGTPIGSNGLDALDIQAVAVRGGDSYAIDRLGRTYHGDGAGRWQNRGRIFHQEPGGAEVSCGLRPALLISPADAGTAVAACRGGVYVTHDHGLTWRHALAADLTDYYDRPLHLQHAGELAASPLYLVTAAGKLYRSGDFGDSWAPVAGPVDPQWGDPIPLLRVLVHPGPGEELLAVDEIGALYRRENGLWSSEGGLELDSGAWQYNHDIAFGYEPGADPERVFVLYRGLISRSEDFGRTFERIGTLVGPYGLPGEHWIPQIVVDPADPDHWFLPFTSGFETHDGGRDFGREKPSAPMAVAFDRLTPGRVLVSSATRGVLEKTRSLEPCPNGDDLWCARSGRYLLTVDWKDPFGNKGRASKVITGSEDSGVFYFFDRNNWELLVKVLDGCGINQRYWLFAAGTTDVEYQLRVEDRWTGQIRHYFNPAGQAAAAITDTDAFAGCAATPPPGSGVANIEPAAAAAGEAALPLVNGRFEATVRWTNFFGQDGDGLTAPLSSDNSGLFYFFSPNNWEMLVKVLNGCAINGHYWLMAAATTNVGYQLTIRDTTGAHADRTYRNPVGRVSPAHIDLQAFSCR